MAKIAGRWSDGVPLSRAPTVAEWKKFNIDYPSVPDLKDGARCRLSSISPTDDDKDAGHQVSDHLPYAADQYARQDGADRRGWFGFQQPPPHHSGAACPMAILSRWRAGLGEHGIVMLVVCASLFRQFEFVQQQWINYGLDAPRGQRYLPARRQPFGRTPGGINGPKAKFVIPADPESGHPPFIVEGLPQFVETRGGDISSSQA